MDPALVTHAFQVQSVLPHDALIVRETTTEHEVLLDLLPGEVPGEIAATSVLQGLEADIIIEAQRRHDGTDIAEHKLGKAEHPEQHDEAEHRTS